MAGLLDLIGVLAIGGGLTTAAWYFSSRARIRRAIKRLPLVAIAEFPAGGVARIAGRIRVVGEPLRAPISQTPCVYFETAVVDGRRGRPMQAVTEAVESGAVPFLVEDASGRALIDPVGARVAIEPDVWREHSRTPSSPAQEMFLRRHAIATRDWQGEKDLHYEERFLLEGDRVVVAGRGLRPSAPGEHGEILRLRIGVGPGQHR